MTTWTVTSGDILDIPADVLVCSANPFLTLSGGVGGAFLLRYGFEMQAFLQSHLNHLGVRHVPPGTVVRAPGCGSPYQAVLHAVAVDGSYESTPQRIADVVGRILSIAEQMDVARIALPALATGYGTLTIAAFAEGIRSLVESSKTPAHVTVCLRRAEHVAAVRRVIGPGAT